MKLIELILTDFQGIEKLGIEFNGQSMDIYGNNGTGKTTIANAYTWLLFDRASTDEKGYSPKTKETHGKEHIVEGIFEFADGERIGLKKAYKEVYKTVRGKDKVFSGHTTDYFINDVPVKASEYKARVAEMTGNDPEAVKILSTPDYFPTMDWRERRNILFQVFGNVPDEEVFSANKELERLKDFTTNQANGTCMTADEYLKMASARLSGRNGINARIELLDAYIEESVKGLQVTDESEIEEIESRRDELQKELDELSRGFITRDDLSLWSFQLSSANSELKSLETKLIQTRQRKKSLEKELLSAESMTRSACPTCKQELPESAVARIQAEKIADIERRIKENEQDEKEYEQRVANLKEEVDFLQKRIDEAKGGLENGIESKIKDKQYDVETANLQLYNAKARLETYQNALKRITSLEEEQKELINELEDLEEGMFLAKEFIREKAKILDERVNRNLTNLQIKFFDTLVNSEIVETCEVLVPKGSGGWIEYNGSSNRAAKLNGGLEMIDILSKAWGLSLPVFLDNAESVTEPYRSDSQMIRLVVSDKDKVLRFERR